VFHYVTKIKQEDWTDRRTDGRHEVAIPRFVIQCSASRGKNAHECLQFAYKTVISRILYLGCFILSQK